MAKPNWKDKTIWTADNLPVMRGMNSESIDLIYLDPPFNSKANYAAPAGSKAAGAEFKDAWTLSDVDVEWINLIGQKYPKLERVILAAMTNSDKSYLAYMAVRILEMQRILKPTGSIYLHCDPTMSHYLKLVMDAIFGRRNFRNEIVWCYQPNGRGPNQAFHKKHDTLLFYAGPGAVFNRPYGEMPAVTVARFNAVDESGRRYKAYDGRRVYLDEARGRPVPDYWEDITFLTTSAERTGYPTQKPLALLERIIKASSDPSGKGGGGRCIRPLLWVRDDAGGCRPFATAVGWRGCVKESRRAGAESHQGRPGTVPVYHSSHGHTAEDGLGTPATVQSSQKQNEVVRRTGRKLRRLQNSLRKTTTGSRPYHCAEQWRNRSPQKSTTAMYPLQQNQRQPWHGVPENPTSNVMNSV